MNFEKRIFQFITKNKLISARGLVLIGVSGGADSMALLLALSALRHDLGIELHAAHFNHQFRPEAKRDERFVVEQCKRLNIPVSIGRRKGQKISHLSEDYARKIRFDFFIKTAHRLKAQSVALAHTRNDLAETVLMRLMRGSGLYGLRAILPKRSIQRIVFVRPLLGVCRADVESYLKAAQMGFCTDETNRRTMYERNKIRLKLMPLLAQEYNPRIIDALSDLSVTVVDDYDFISSYAHREFDKICTVSKGRVKMKLANIKRQHPAMVRLMLRRMVESLKMDASVLTFEHIHALQDLIATDAKGALDLPHQLKAVRTSKFLELRAPLNFCASEE